MTIWTMRRSRISKPWQNGQWMTSRAPVLRQAVDLGKLVHQAGGGQNPTSHDGVTTDEFDTEAVVIRAGHPTDATGEDLAAVAADLLTTDAVSSEGGSPS